MQRAYAAAVIAALLAGAAPPAVSGGIKAPELGPGRVTLIRDLYGTPHLYAAEEADAFYGLGYAYGEDRLQQTLLYYLAVSGRLAETFGAGSLADRPELRLPKATIRDTVKSDLQARQFRYLEDARANFAKLPPRLQANMRAFIAGLQRYMADHPGKVPHWAPPLEPAMPVALLAQMMVLDFPTICDARINASPAAESHPDRQSNAWAVSGSKTASGAVYFSSDSHGGLMGEFGPLFYNWRMKAGGLDVLSFDLPGAASFFFAHTDRFGWGWTEGNRNVADCYAVKTDPADPRAFDYDGRRRQMEVVPYTIKVKGAASVTGSFEYTRHNGVRSPVVRRSGNLAYVMSSPYLGRWGLAAAQYDAMARAQNRAEFTKALEAREIYSANLVAGGADGTLLYIRPGRIPMRKPGVDAGRLLDGNSSATAWLGVHPYEDLTKLINPAQGFISNSNVSPDRMYPNSPLQPQNYPPYFGFEPGLITTRQSRLIELLAPARGLTIEQALSIVMDEKLFAADLWGPIVAGAARRHPALVSAGGAPLRAVLGELAAFDGRFAKESRGALYFAMMRGELTMKHPEADAIVAAVENGKQLSAAQEQILLAAIRATADALMKRHGRVDLAYGDIHRVAYGDKSLPVGGTSFFAGRDLPEHMTRGTGANRFSVADTVRKMVFNSPQVSTAEPAMLMSGQRIPYFVAFTNPLQSYSQLLPGISEDRASPHSSDQALLASEGKLKPTYFNLPDLMKNMESMRVIDVRRSAK